jgi:hypothetical protein
MSNLQFGVTTGGTETLSNIFIANVTGATSGNIIRLYDYSTGDYSQWNVLSGGDEGYPYFWGIPHYGRPAYPADGATRYPGIPSSWFGNGDLMELVQNVGGRSGYANKVTVKNSANTTEAYSTSASVIGDWDTSSGPAHRRTELHHHTIVGLDGVTMPYLSERWISISFYLPSDWDSVTGSSWNVLFQIKNAGNFRISPSFSIELKNADGGGYSWRINHNTALVDHPNDWADVLWQYLMFYDDTYPNLGGDWPDGLADFPEAGSQAALGVVTKGGWTDFVFQIKFDGRGSQEGGTGFMNVWKRDDGVLWTQVLAITPRVTTRGGETFDHGIGYRVPGGGFGPLTGIYCDNSQVLPLPANRVLYNANLKIGDENASLAEMSPD